PDPDGFRRAVLNTIGATLALLLIQDDRMVSGFHIVTSWSSVIKIHDDFRSPVLYSLNGDRIGTLLHVRQTHAGAETHLPGQIGSGRKALLHRLVDIGDSRPLIFSNHPQTVFGHLQGHPPTAGVQDDVHLRL